MRTTWTFHSAGKILLGPDAVHETGRSTAELSVRKTLVVTDPNLIRAGVVSLVEEALQQAGIEFLTFSGGEPEPSTQVLETCLEFARPFQPQGIIGVGGGSNMDLAKMLALLLSHGGTYRDYLGDSRVPGPVLPIICVPTTAGTGSEVTGAAVVTDHAQQMKVSTLSNFLRPRVAIVDPKLTLSCPPQVTADTGIDALTHAIEAYTVVDNELFDLRPGTQSVYQGLNPMADLFAEKAIELVGRHLVTAVRNGHDPAARHGMMLAATLGGLAFSNAGVALVHAMEYPIGGATHCSHGAGNGLLLPHVMRFNLPTRVERFARIAQLLGRETAGLSSTEAAQAAVAAVVDLQQQIGIPLRLRDLGAKEEQIPLFAEKAVAVKRLLRVNPRPVTQADCEDIYRAAF